MSINATTLSATITANQTVFQVASATGITAPNFTTGVNVTYLMLDREMMLVTAVSGTFVTVVRGWNGTQAVTHNVTTSVVAGLAADFPNFKPTVGVFDVGLPTYQGANAPIASATAITLLGQISHITGTTQIQTINLPPNFVEGTVRLIFDGVATWTTGGNIAVAGTPTTAGSYVDFYYDAGKTLWYPSRLA